MRKGVDHRTIAKPGARQRASRGETGDPIDLGQDKRPRGAARLGGGRGIDLASVLIVAPRGTPATGSPRARQFRNPFNENDTSRGLQP
jgi:hypothetical protein